MRQRTALNPARFAPQNGDDVRALMLDARLDATPEIEDEDEVEDDYD